MNIQNYVPGVIIKSTNKDMPELYEAEILKSAGENVSCAISNRVADCKFKNQTCSLSRKSFANFTFDLSEPGKVLHIDPAYFL